MRFVVGFFFVDVARRVVVFDAGFFAVAALVLDVLAVLFPALLDVLASLLAVFAVAFAGAAARTSLIALVCSWSVIRNS